VKNCPQSFAEPFEDMVVWTLVGVKGRVKEVVLDGYEIMFRA